MIDSVTVAVPARLHLGFLDLHGGLGRRFGSLGLALDAPRTRLRLSRAGESRTEGPDAARAARAVETLARALGIPVRHHLIVGEAIPPHAGLGSGTQIALAAAAALRRLHGLPLDARGDAARLGRGARSGIGVGLFETGGVVLDGGRGRRDEPPPVIARLPFPDDWRILLVLDPARQGVHGAAETDAFAALPQFPEDEAARLCRLTLMRALPGLAEADIEAFGGAVTEIQARVGDHFAPAQGGRFASPAVAAALDLLAEAGVAGYGQSSWGPTGFAFAAGEIEARRLSARLAPLAERLGFEVQICRGRNRGADIEPHAAAKRSGAHYG